jgi:hypothetical protein
MLKRIFLKSLVGFSLCAPSGAWAWQASNGVTDVNLSCSGVKLAAVVGLSVNLCTDDSTGKRYFVGIGGLGVSGMAAIQIMGVSCSAKTPRYWSGINYGNNLDYFGKDYYSVYANLTDSYRKNFRGWYSGLQGGILPGIGMPTNSQRSGPDTWLGFANKNGECDVMSTGVGLGIDLSAASMVIWRAGRNAN